MTPQRSSVYQNIARNNIKTIFLMLMFPLILIAFVFLACLAAVYFIKDEFFLIQGVNLLLRWFPSVEDNVSASNAYVLSAAGYMLYAVVPIFVIGSIWMLISLFFGDKMMLAFADATPLSKKDNPKVYRTVENVAIAAGLPMPQVFVIEDESMNAFATGYSPKSASIALTTGIIKRLKPLELEGVIAHEMAHIGNRDIRLNMVIITGLSIFTFLGDYLRISMYGKSSKKENQLQILIFFIIIALMVFSFIVAPLLHMAVSRTREYAADATGALMTRNPKALANALRKISQDARVEILDEQPSMASACIADPKEDIERAQALSSLSATHPPIDARITRLDSMA